MYWFRPKRWGKWIAVYYPASRIGWFFTILIVLIAVAMFCVVHLWSHSWSDTLKNFVPWALVFLFAYDALCIRFGEYPSWWGKRHRAWGIVSTLVIAYVLTYIFFRGSHTEIWRQDKNEYVIFPNKIVYYIYRPIVYLDDLLTDMRFHIGPHQ